MCFFQPSRFVMGVLGGCEYSTVGIEGGRPRPLFRGSWGGVAERQGSWIRGLLAASFICIIASAFGSAARADLLTSQAVLDGILGDQVQIEDFEGFSLHGGTFQDAPNPLNASTAPAYMGIQPGVTYGSPRWLRFYATTLLGDDSIVLAGDYHIDVDFHQRQLAVGLYTKNITGNLDYQNTISFYRDGQLLGSADYVLPSGAWTFYGWRDPLGVDRISVNSSNAWAIVDNIEWGIAVPEPSMGMVLAIVAAWALNDRRRR